MSLQTKLLNAFVSFLDEMGYLDLKSYLPPFNTPEDLVYYFNKAKLSIVFHSDDQNTLIDFLKNKHTFVESNELGMCKNKCSLFETVMCPGSKCMGTSRKDKRTGYYEQGL